MASIEIAHLSERLSDEEIAELAGALEALGAPQLPKLEDSGKRTIGDDLDHDALTEFMDRLEAHDVAAEIYLPIEFEGVVDAGDLRVGSLPALIDTLTELKDDFNLEEEDEEEDEDEDEEEDEDGEDDEDDDDDDDDDEDSPAALVERRLRDLWKMFSTGAKRALDAKLPLHVRL